MKLPDLYSISIGGHVLTTGIEEVIQYFENASKSASASENYGRSDDFQRRKIDFRKSIEQGKEYEIMGVSKLDENALKTYRKARKEALEYWALQEADYKHFHQLG